MLPFKKDVMQDISYHKGRVSFNIYISLVIYTFRGRVRAYMEGNEMLFQIILYIVCGFVRVVSVLYR